MIASGVVIFIGVFRELILLAFANDFLLNYLRPFALDAENTAPTWYSSLLLFAIAMLLFCAASLAKSGGEPLVFRWRLLSLVFLGLSMDEASSFHELPMQFLRELLNVSGFFYFAWVIPAAFFVAALAIYYLPFLRKLPRETATGMAIAGALYVTGAIGFEMIGAFFWETSGRENLFYILAATIEESIEIAALTLFFVVVSKYLEDRFGDWSVTMKAAKTK